MATNLLALAAKSAAGPQSAVANAVRHLPTTFTNVSAPERWLSLGLGGGLMIFGATSRGAPSVLAMVAGGLLAYRGLSGHCAAYQAMGVSTADATAPNSAIAAGHGSRVDAAITVRAPAREAYLLWRDFENLPRFMGHLLQVDTTTDGRSRWAARGPLGTRVEWDAEIVTDRAGEVISWKSLAGSDVDTAGSVHFRELGDGRTEVKVELKYDPPAGKVGSAVMRWLDEPLEQQVNEALQRFKEILEASDRVRTK